MTHRHALCAAILGLGALLSSPASAADLEARVAKFKEKYASLYPEEFNE